MSVGLAEIAKVNDITVRTRGVIKEYKPRNGLDRKVAWVRVLCGR